MNYGVIIKDNEIIIIKDFLIDIIDNKALLKNKEGFNSLIIICHGSMVARDINCLALFFFGKERVLLLALQAKLVWCI